MDSKIITRAIVVWAGRDRTAWPDRSEESLVVEFGPDGAPDLLSEIRRLEDDFYASNAWQIAPDLASVGEQAAADFRSRHPEIGEEAVQALAWCYTYDYK